MPPKKAAATKKNTSEKEKSTKVVGKKRARDEVESEEPKAEATVESTASETPAPADSTAETKESAKTEEKKSNGKGKGKAKTATAKKGKEAAEPPKKKQKTAKKETKEEEEEEEEERLWNGWKQMYFVGTEWENYDQIFSINWDFSDLLESLESGKLSKLDHTPYLFGLTEPQLLALDPAHPDIQKVVLVPVIVAIDSKVPPPSTVSITSVMRCEEEIVPMSKLKIGWQAWNPKADGAWAKPPERTKAKAFWLQCSQRRSGLKGLDTMRIKDFEYALPYIWIPKNDQANSGEVDSVVHVVHSLGGIGLTFEFDWKFDEVDEFVPEVLESNGLDVEKFKGELTELIQGKVREAKEAIKAERQARQKRLEEMPPAQVEALNELKCYKYYPRNSIGLLTKTAFINRYYGKASEIF